MDDDDTSPAYRAVNADDYQQGWLAGWLCAQGYEGAVPEDRFVEALRAWQTWLAANGSAAR